MIIGPQRHFSFIGFIINLGAFDCRFGEFLDDSHCLTSKNQKPWED